MDALRLLTRSTKLAKKGSAATTTTTTLVQTPSSGPARTPQLFDHDGHSQASNRKRKRDSDVGTPSLDFFGAGASSKERETTEQEEQHTGRHDEAAAVQHAQLSSDECKQLLGRHKIKVTLFPSASVSASSEAPAKKKKKNDVNKDKKEQEPTALYPVPVSDFGSLAPRYRISKALLRNIKDNGYSTTTEVQLAALPLLLGSRADLIPHSNKTRHVEQGKQQDTEQDKTKDTEQDKTKDTEQEKTKDTEQALHVDLLSIAPTGSGKTLAFIIPLIHALTLSRRTQPQSTPRAIVLAPTKELCSQVANEGRKLALNTGIRITNVRKGMHLGPEADDNKVPPVKADVLVSTPAALKNAIGDLQKSADALSHIRFLVLDEADVLLDPLFRDHTLSVWNALSNPCLRLGFWSATMGSSIEELVKSTIKTRATNLSIPIAPFIRLVVGLKDSAVPNIHHRLIYAATEQGKLLALRQLLHPTSTTIDAQPVVRAPFLIFTQTIERAVALHSELLYDIPAEAGGISRISVLHSNLSDTARDNVMTRFRKGDVWILITTDLLSRGVDFRGINAVVNYDAPTSAAAYVHRVGRTGRAGREGGVALTYYTDDDVASIKTVANIIVASQKQRGAAAAGDKTNIQQWLLDALPTPSKRDKQQLKKRGIETRRSVVAVAAAAPGAKDNNKNNNNGKSKAARISTKSGYIRKLENNKKAAVKASKNPGNHHHHHSNDQDSDGGDGESFAGFDE